MNDSILIFRRMRYLKVALALGAVCIVAYVLHRPLGPPNGGTWLGYTLGVISGGLMVWLAWFGIKKRSYGAGRWSAQEWLSAHVYLGGALALVATLHAGFRFGVNIHTVLYVLMMIVIISGMFGVFFYMRYPRLLTEKPARHVVRDHAGADRRPGPGNPSTCHGPRRRHQHPRVECQPRHDCRR